MDNQEEWELFYTEKRNNGMAFKKKICEIQMVHGLSIRIWTASSREICNYEWPSDRT